MNHVLSHRPRRRLAPLNPYSVSEAVSDTTPQGDVVVPADITALLEMLDMQDPAVPVVQEKEKPTWNPDMDRAELIAVAQAMGLPVSKMDNKATILKALKNAVV